MKDNNQKLELSMDQRIALLPTKKMLDMVDVFLLTGYQIGTIKNMVSEGRLIPYKPTGVRGTPFFDREEIERFMKSHHTGDTFSSEVVNNLRGHY